MSSTTSSTLASVSGHSSTPATVCSAKASGSASFKVALTKFQNKLTGKDLTDFQKTTCVSLCQDIVRIQHEQDDLKTMMNLCRIQSCIEAMKQFGTVIEICLNVHNAVAFVWGPFKLLLVTASTFADSFETILEAYEQIGEQLPLLLEFEDLFRSNPHMVNALELMYIDILDFHQHAMKFVSGKLWKQFFRSMWKDFETKFGGILKSLGRHKDFVESCASIAQYRTYQDDIKKLKANVEELVVEEKEKKMSVVKEWLKMDLLPENDHNTYRAINGEYPGTGKWIGEKDIFKDWLEADNPLKPLLWMTGIPGAGKTILASVIIDECKQRKEFLTSYYYCHYNEAKGNAMVGLLKGLLNQLLDQHPQLLPSVSNST